MEEYYIISTGEKIRIMVDENLFHIIAYNHQSDVIGRIELDERDTCYHITWMYFDLLGDKYLKKGIGRKCLVFFKDFLGTCITASDNDGQQRSDGSHLTGDAPGFIDKMREEGIVK